jgi:hypothetical protein
VNPLIAETLDRIMQDERWHIDWVQKALESMEPEYGRETIDATVRRFWEADREVYQRTVQEHEQRIGALLERK